MGKLGTRQATARSSPLHLTEKPVISCLPERSDTGPGIKRHWLLRRQEQVEITDQPWDSEESVIAN